eukprot:s1175_g4.t1
MLGIDSLRFALAAYFDLFNHHHTACCAVPWEPKNVMASLRYLRTFIDEVSEAELELSRSLRSSKSWPQLGSHQSFPPDLETTRDASYVAELEGKRRITFGQLQMPPGSETKMAMTTSHSGPVEEAAPESPEPIIEVQAAIAALPVPPGSGSWGHPALCRRPCIHFAKGACNMGYACDYCHCKHDHHVTPDKRQRLLLNHMETSELLAVLLPHVRRSLEVAQIEAPDIIVMLEGEVGSTRAPNVDSMLLRTLRRMPLSALLGLIMTRDGFRPFLEEQVEVLRCRLR